MRRFPPSPFRPLASPVPLLRDRRGTALIEMAITLPVFLMLLFGIISYGDWFFLAHNVQQAANDAARATIAGLNPAERATIAEQAVQTSLRRAGTLNPTKMNVAIDDDGSTLVIRLSYDASADPLFALRLFPMPATTIDRRAAIRLESL